MSLLCHATARINQFWSSSVFIGVQSPESTDTGPQKSSSDLVNVYGFLGFLHSKPVLTKHPQQAIKPDQEGNQHSVRAWDKQETL